MQVGVSVGVGVGGRQGLARGTNSRSSSPAYLSSLTLADPHTRARQYTYTRAQGDRGPGVSTTGYDLVPAHFTHRRSRSGRLVVVPLVLLVAV